MMDDEETPPPVHSRRQQARRGGKGSTPRRPLWKVIRLWAVALLILGLIELGAAALTAPQFAVAVVDVMGLEVTPEETVHSIAAQLEGQNWLQAQTAQVKREVEALPAVKQASIGRVLDWPPRLVLDVEERQPFLKVGAGEEWWIVDNQGVPFRRATAGDTDLYAVTGPKIEPRLGRPLPAEVWRPVLQLATALLEDNRIAEETQEGSSWKLRRIYLDKNGFAAVRLKGGDQDSLLVRLGDERWRDKLQRARQALAYFQQAGARAEVLNLVSFNMPTWTPHRQYAASNSASENQNPESSSALSLPPATADSESVPEAEAEVQPDNTETDNSSTDSASTAVEETT